jgi:hypothetical protein
MDKSCEKSTGIAAFDRLVDHVMTQPLYCEAGRFFPNSIVLKSACDKPLCLLM